MKQPIPGAKTHGAMYGGFYGKLFCIFQIFFPFVIAILYVT